MKIVVAPDSFKDCLSAMAVADCLAEGILEAAPGCEVEKIPLSDGGEGFAEAASRGSGAAGRMLTIGVHGPLGDPVEAKVFLSSDGTAAVECASACGLELVPSDRRDPWKTTTYGFGELLKALAARGDVRRIVTGLGGSATVDGGLGMLQALGFRFYDAAKVCLPPGVSGAALERVASIEFPEKGFRLPPLTTAVDVQNPLCGERGAALVFAPQKGASREEAARLEKGMLSYAQAAGDLGTHPGDGAAGGLGYALRHFLHAQSASGAAILLDLIGFERRIANADLVVTGEGASDRTTLEGKLPFVAANRVAARGIASMLVSGRIDPAAEPALKKVFRGGVLAISDKNLSLEENLRRAPKFLRAAGKTLTKI